MNHKVLVLSCTLLLAACGESSDSGAGNEQEFMNRIDSCDRRYVTGTCLEYTLSELDEWYREHVESACSSNTRGDIVATYRKNTSCPTEDRVARCMDFLEDPDERYEYDKHYYAGTADGFDWEASNVRTTCEHVSGKFLPD